MGLNLALGIYDGVMALLILSIAQVSTRSAGFHDEYRVRSLLRRIIYYLILLTLCYRTYALAEDQWPVTLAGFVSGAVLTGSIATLGFMDMIWERKKRCGTCRR